MTGYSKKTRESIRESAFDKKKKKPGLKFNPWLALTGVRTTGSRALNQIITVTKITMFKFSPLCSSFLPWWTPAKTVPLAQAPLGSFFRSWAWRLYPACWEGTEHHSEIGWRTLLVELHSLKMFCLLANGQAAPWGWISFVDVYWTTYPSKLALG